MNYANPLTKRIKDTCRRHNYQECVELMDEIQAFLKSDAPESEKDEVLFTAEGLQMMILALAPDD